MFKQLITGAIFATVSGITVLAAAPNAFALTFTYSNNTPVNIPVADSVSSDIVISDTGAIDNLAVTISGFNHPWAGDLIARLTNVNTNTTVDLFNRIGRIDTGFGSGSEFNGTYSFSNAFTASIWSSAAASSLIAPGNYAPTTIGGSLTSLSAFNGQGLAGTWRLSISNLEPYDTGSFSGWTLSGNTASNAAVPVPPQVVGTAVLAGLTAVKKLRLRKTVAA
jgi:subtilisin-like proprotein convertase family protein